jgi:SSS family solute:Na+ symporter
VRYLNLLDYSVISLYFLILLGMGIYFQRLASRSMEDYFLGGKSLPWWALGISGMGNFLDMTGTMVIVSFLYMLGPRGLFIEFRGGAVLVLAFGMLWVGKWHRRSNCMTMAEWNIYRFGTGSWAQGSRVIVAVANIVFNLGMLAYLIKGAGLFLSMFMPFPPLWCAAIMVGLTIIYSMMSGFYGVVYTDVFQCFIIVAAVIIVTTMAVVQVGASPEDLAVLANRVTGAENWTSSAPHWHTPMPRGYEVYQSLTMFMMFYLLKTILDGMGWGYDPKYFAARNERDCGLLSLFWASLMVFRWPMMIGFAVMGLFLVDKFYSDREILAQTTALIKQSPEVEQRFGKNIPKDTWEDVLADITIRQKHYPRLIEQLRSPQLLTEDWQTRIQLVSYEGTVNPERVLPAVILFSIPEGLRGLFVVALLAAAMSTFTPQVNMSTALFTRDIYQAYLRPRAGTRELIWASYAFGAVLSLISFAMAAKTTNINMIWGWIIMGLGTGLVIPRLLRLYWWRYNAAGTVVGTLVGLAGAAVLWFGMILFPDIQLLKNEIFQFLAMISITLVANIAGTYLDAPTDLKTLTHFYRTTRPFGRWGPLRHTLSPEQRRKTDRENFYDVISTPFALGWQVCLFLLPMQAVIRNWSAFRVTLVIFLVCMGGLYWFWYRNLPPASQIPPEGGVPAEEEAFVSGAFPVAVAASEPSSGKRS